MKKSDQACTVTVWVRGPIASSEDLLSEEGDEGPKIAKYKKNGSNLSLISLGISTHDFVVLFSHMVKTKQNKTKQNTRAQMAQEFALHTSTILWSIIVYTD